MYLVFLFYIFIVILFLIVILVSWCYLLNYRSYIFCVFTYFRNACVYLCVRAGADCVLVSAVARVGCPVCGRGVPSEAGVFTGEGETFVQHFAAASAGRSGLGRQHRAGLGSARHIREAYEVPSMSGSYRGAQVRVDL